MRDSILRAAVAAALFACLASSSFAAPGADALSSGSSAFPYGRQIILLGEGGPAEIGAWPGNARPRDSFPYPGGFVAWERKSGRVMRFGPAGLEDIGAIAADQVFLSRDAALARAELFEAGKGFAFNLYALGDRVVKGKALSLDCFPADCLFLGRYCYLVGADQADREHRLYEIELSSGRTRLLASLPKKRDFGRLVAGKGRIWLFLSPAEPRREKITILNIKADGGSPAANPEPVALNGLPGAALSFYGSGFFFDGLFWLPVAVAGGSGGGTGCAVSLAALDPEAAASVPRLILPLGTGLYAPLCGTPGSFWAVGFLYLKDPGAFSLLRIAGGEATGTPLPIGGR